MDCNIGLNSKRKVHISLNNAEESQLCAQYTNSQSSRRSSAVTNHLHETDQIAATNPETLRQELQLCWAQNYTKESFLIKQQMAEKESGKLQVQQQITRAKSKSSIF